MKIKHLTFSTSGGAGQVARLLADQQLRLGLDAELLTLTDNDLQSQPFENIGQTTLAALDNFVIRNREFESLISLSRDQLSGVKAENLFDADVVHLHWINGVISRREMNRVSRDKTIIWTLHDSAPFTGSCHLPLDCIQYRASCERCPQVRAPFHGLVSRNFREKALFARGHKELTFVAPSKWIKEAAVSSGILSNSRIELIRNPIDSSFFQEPSRVINSTNNLVGLIIANDLADPNKRVLDTIQAFIKGTTHASDVKLLLVGKNGQRFSDANGKVIWLGQKNVEELRDIVAGVDFLMVMSKSENAPLVIAESAACGTPAIVHSKTTGAVEAIVDGKTGIVVKDFNELSALLSEPDRLKEKLHSMRKGSRELAFDRHHPDSVTRQYMDLYSAS